MSNKRATRARAKGLAPIPLSADLTIDLEAFCAAHYKAAKGEVIRRALRFFIDSRLEAEPEMRARFVEERVLLTKKRVSVVPFRAQETGKSDQVPDHEPDK